MTNDDLDQYDDYCVVGRWHQPALPGSCWVHWQKSNRVKRLLGLDLSPLVFIDGYTLMKLEDIRHLGNMATNWSNEERKRFAQDFVNESEHAKLSHLSVHLPHDCGDISELVETYLEVVGLWWLCIALDQAGAVSFASSAPTHRRTWLQEILREQLILAEQSRQMGVSCNLEDPRNLPSELRIKIENHVASYPWYGTHHWHGSPYSFSKAIAEVLAKMESASKPEETQMHSGDDLASELVFWRLHFAEVTAKSVFANRLALQSFARRLGLQYGELIHLSYAEVIQLSNRSITRTPTKELLHERFLGYTCNLNNAGQEIVESNPVWVKQATSRVRELGKSTGTSASFLFQGSVACQGPRIRGVAELISDPTKTNFTNAKAEILVAYETTPDFVPFLNRYKGVVTQMGGVTSHAAVICREMSIPCIVGANGLADAVTSGQVMDVDFSTGRILLVEQSFLEKVDSNEVS